MFMLATLNFIGPNDCHLKPTANHKTTVPTLSIWYAGIMGQTKWRELVVHRHKTFQPPESLLYFIISDVFRALCVPFACSM